MKNFVKTLLIVTLVGTITLGMTTFASDVTDPIIKPTSNTVNVLK